MLELSCEEENGGQMQYKSYCFSFLLITLDCSFILMIAMECVIILTYCCEG